MHLPRPSQFAQAANNIGRRSAARLRLSMPGKLVTIYETRPCVIMNLSQTGARISLESPLSEGASAFLQCGRIDQFAMVVRRERGSNGLEFDVPMTHDQVLAIRDFAENLDDLERKKFRQMARDWITGGH